MHHLKEEMIRNLQLKGFSPKTQTAYLQYMKDFTRYFGRSPVDMGEAEIKEYLHYLITEKKVSRSYVNCAILSWEELLFKLTGLDPGTCPNCQKGKMITCELLQTGKDPPIRWGIINKFNNRLPLYGKLSIESP